MKKLIMFSIATLTSSFFAFNCKAQYTDLFNFNGTNGEGSSISLTLSGSVLYGMTENGGANNDGVIFSIDTDGSNFKDLLDFNGTNGRTPFSGLTLLGNKIYGLAYYGGANNKGVIFSIDTDGSNYKDLFDFNGTNGNGPIGDMTLEGIVLYGMANAGGAHGRGCVFSIDTNGSGYKDLLDFNGINGYYPQIGGLTLLGNRLFGMTIYGGANDSGLIFSIDTNSSNYKDLFDFNGTNGAAPWGSLTLSGCNLYGMTSGYPSGKGNIFSIDTNGSNYKNLFNFNGTNGSGPRGNLTLSGSVLYGMTLFGGANDSGCIFSIDTNGSGYTDLFDFNGTDGMSPWANLTLSGNILYGMTYKGGANSDGVIFSFKDNNIATSTNVLIANQKVFNIYPNPCTGQFTLAFHSSPSLSGEEYPPIIEVYNVLGEKVFFEIPRKLQNNYTINISNQPAGIYLLSVTRKDIKVNQKLIIIN